MKYIFVLSLCSIFYLRLFAQPFPEFSPLSGRDATSAPSAKAMGSYYYLQNGYLDGQRAVKIHRLDNEGHLLDSFNLRPDSTNRAGWIKAIDNRLFFHGLKWTGNPFRNMRHNVIEFDRNLNIIREIVGASLTPSMGRTNWLQTGSIVTEQIADFNIYKDTILAAYEFFVVDSPQVLIGNRNFFIKTGMDGTVFTSKQFPSNRTYNITFVGNKFYLQGSVYASAFNPKALGEFNSEGNLIRSTDYDNYGSGEFPEGSLGGWHNGRFYFSYVSKNPTLSGCNINNAAIDVRDSTWKVLHRFKLPDCEYEVSGRMPFSFDAQNNVYYTAPHKSYKKMMVYKFTPDFQLIWKKELDFNDRFPFYFPTSHLPADDGGILLNCFEIVNAIQNLRIYKISSDGNVVSSTRLPGGTNSATGPLAFPNPTTGPLTLTPEYAAATQAQLSTIDGRHLGFVPLQDQQIDLSAQPAGVYTLTLWDMKARKMLGAQVIVKE